MAAVVEPGRQDRHEGIEDRTFDAHALQHLVVMPRQGEDAADVVVNHAHIHARGRLVGQYLQNRIPQLAWGNDEILHKNIVLGTPQLLQKPGEKQLSRREIGGVRISVGGAAGHALQISGLVDCIRPHIAEHFRVAVRLKGLNRPQAHALHLPPGAVGQAVAAKEQVKQPAHQGKQQNGDNPGDFIGRVSPAPHDPNHGNQAQKYAEPVKVNEVFVKLQDDQQQHNQLQHDGRGHQNEPVKQERNQLFHPFASCRSTTFSAPSSSRSSATRASWITQVLRSLRLQSAA
ncbi:hypothetical protein SDC9_125038 [bioreactor metagenome]|uniref:Uncharacterized protein n=1 Tax=bioreactor metagenome TaxID=1076179 RepID=A0A645CM89_9ZZZZ